MSDEWQRSRPRLPFVKIEAGWCPLRMRWGVAVLWRPKPTAPWCNPYQRCLAVGINVNSWYRLRRADLVMLGPQHMRNGRIAWRQSKTGDMTTPVRPAPETLDAIAAAPPGLLWLATEQGRARTPAGFGSWFREACDKAGLHGLTAHGLRHTLGADAASSGDGAINALLGHRSDSPEAATYRAQAAAMAMADEAYHDQGLPFFMSRCRPTGRMARNRICRNDDAARTVGKPPKYGAAAWSSIHSLRVLFVLQRPNVAAVGALPAGENVSGLAAGRARRVRPIAAASLVVAAAQVALALGAFDAHGLPSSF